MYLIIDEFYIKIINFDRFCEKKFAWRRRKITLGGEQASGGPLRGG